MQLNGMTMKLKEVIATAKDQLQWARGMEISSVIGVSKTTEGWQATIELIERKAIPDTQDILGVYEVLLDSDGDMLSYERKRVRKRMDLEETLE